MDPDDIAVIAAEYQAMQDLGRESVLGGTGGGEDDAQFIDNIDGDWLNLCQLAAKPVSKEDIIFKTLEDSKLAENHIVICGMVENIRHFVMPLRSKYLKEPIPIVILNEELPA